MSDVSDRYQRVAEGFETRLSAVKPDQLALPTPCSEWDLDGLIAHVIATHGRVLTAATETPPEWSGDVLEQWSAARAAIAGALQDPACASKVVGGLFGEQPFEQLVGRLLCADTLFHTWDLARATGQDERLDPEAVAKAMEFLEPIDEAIRRPGGFAAKVAPPADADAQTRLLNFGGRAV